MDSEELFNMLINPTDHDFALRWHRDDVRENASEEEERTALAIWQHGVSKGYIHLLRCRINFYKDTVEYVNVF